MSSPPLFDIDDLLHPIRPDFRVGEDLRADSSPTSPYYQIKDARNQARAAERHALMTGDADAPPADWSLILALVPQVLAQSAKDLEITAYYIEALVRQEGFPGLREGFLLVHRLVDEYEDIYPQADEDGAETTVAPLAGLNGDGADGTLIAPIAAIPLTAQTSEGAFSQADYVSAKEMEGMADDARERRLSQGAVTMTTFQMAVNETSAEYFLNLREDIAESIEAFAQLTNALDQRFGQDSPPSSAIRQALEACQETLLAIAGDKLAISDTPEEVADDTEGTDGDSAASAGDGAAAKPKEAGRIENREDAFREIMRISAYFRKTEPHSPISYALEQIVRWGRLPLPDLLKEVIDDESSISQMFRLVGIKPSDEQSDN